MYDQHGIVRLPRPRSGSAVNPWLRLRSLVQSLAALGLACGLLAAVLVPGARGGSTTVADDPPVVRYTSCTPAADWGSPSLRLAAKLLAAHNRERSKRRLPLLLSDPALTRAAQWKALRMAARHEHSHADLNPDGTTLRTWLDRLTDCGFPPAMGAAENIAWDRPRTTDAVKINTIIAAWLRSPGHRANLLDPQWHTVGIGVAVTPSTVTYAVDFAAGPSP